MPNPLETKPFYDFGNFRLDTNERVLLSDGKPVSITPKAFRLLQILVENHGRIVDKETLMSDIWPDSFVEEGNLAVSAGMVRKALGDDAAEPSFIETIPRRGYRFIAEVSMSHPPSIEPVQLDASASRSSARQVYGNYYAVAGVLVLITAIGAIGWIAKDRIFGSAAAPILSHPFSSTRFSTSGTVTNAAISPDGKYAAFTDTSGGTQSLWLRQIESGENIQIVPPSRDHYFGLAFSNGGTAIYFVRKPLDGHVLPAIYRVAAFGGIPVKLVDGAMNWISLSPDDSKISFFRCTYKPDDNCSLFLANADGTNERRLLSKPAPILMKGNRFSPDGRSIAISYGEHMTDTPDFRLALVDASTGAETEMPQKFFEIRSVEWLPSGNELLFTARDYEDGQLSIWKTPIAGGPPEIVTKDASSYQNLDLDRNGERMIATQVDNDFQLYVVSEGEQKALTSARDLSLGLAGRIAYSTFDGDIWATNFDGSERRQLTTGPWGDILPRFSPDGRYIFFKSNRSGDSDVWRMNADGSGLLQIYRKTSGGPCGVTADGKWLAYINRMKLHKISVDGGDTVPISDRKLLRPACSPDGKLVAYYFLENGFKIGVMNTSNGDVEKVLNYGDEKALPQRIAWSPDSRTLNYVVNTNGKNILWQQSLSENARRTISDLGGEEIRDLVMLPDGKSFAFVRGKWINDAVLITGLK